MKEILFLDLLAPSTWVNLPPTVQGRAVSASLITWDFEGVDYATDVHGHLNGPFYAQIRFSGGLTTGTMAHGARPDCVQVPLITFDGFPAQTKFPIPISENSLVTPRFLVEVFSEGMTPALLPFERALLWILLETKDGDSGSTGSTRVPSIGR